MGRHYWCPLTTSRRSTPALVSLTNAVFGGAFLPDLTPQDVQLQPDRKDLPNQPSLLNWNFESSKNGTDYLALGQAVAELLGSGIQVEDKATKTLRAVQPGDIGVLCRKHDQVDLAVTSLTQWGILPQVLAPACWEQRRPSLSWRVCAACMTSVTRLHPLWC